MKEVSGLGSITKRFIVAVLSSGLIYWSLKVHRDWVFAYFDSMMQMPTQNAELANVATASISAITTAFIAGSSSIAFIVAFFITGNVAALQSMFKWQNLAQTTGETVSESINERITQESKVDERIVQEFSERYKDDPSYVKLPKDDGEVWR